MIDLKKTRLRAGYRRADVDDYLLEVASELDRCHDDIEDLMTQLDRARVGTAQVSDGVGPTSTDDAALLLEAAQRVARETRRAAEASASELVGDTKRSLGDLERRAGQKRRTVLAEAHRQARELVEQARSSAERMERLARERRREIEHLESELGLRLGYAERRLDERAHALAAEARRLDELAEWLGLHDLLPEMSERAAPRHRTSGEDDQAEDDPVQPALVRPDLVERDPAQPDPAVEQPVEQNPGEDDPAEEARRII
jgi:cell division septum initiation protein DivIVA